MCCREGVGFDVPLGLRKVHPHEDTDGHGEGSVHEAGLEIKCKEHGRGGIAMKDQLGNLPYEWSGWYGHTR